MLLMLAFLVVACAQAPAVPTFPTEQARPTATHRPAAPTRAPATITPRPATPIVAVTATTPPANEAIPLIASSSAAAPTAVPPAANAASVAAVATVPKPLPAQPTVASVATVASPTVVPSPPPTPRPPTATPSPTPSTGHTYYLSSFDNARYYYCDNDPEWKALSPKYLVHLATEADVHAKYPTYTRHKDC